MPRTRNVRIPFFQIWYSSAFLALAFIAWVATLLTPGDLVYACVRSKSWKNGIAIGSVYVLTVFVGLFIWASRIYTNRAVLRDIPRSYIPVDKGEVPNKVNKLIIQQWHRSAIIAWDSRPRDVRDEIAKQDEMEAEGEERHRLIGLLKGHSKETTVIRAHVVAAAWGYLSHPGWSSPANDSLPNLQYSRVFVELPNLIEAKAVSLAPPDAMFFEDGLTDFDTDPVPDARIVALLQRPAAQGLREYLDRLISLNVIDPPETAETFLAEYEVARFSTTALTEQQFSHLMETFSSLLTGMTSLDLAMIEPELSGSSSASSLMSFDSSEASSHLQVKRRSAYSAARSRHSSQQGHVRSNSTGTVKTSISRSKMPHTLHQMPSSGSLTTPSESMSSLRGGDRQLASSPSTPSLSSNGSVIRLRPSQLPGEEPYEYNFDREDD